ncbi:MAG: hypothetical protein J0I12_09775 [Candidatus Eremiobacteraeota bacterium]|mgnify:CR=1 FL=1|nr:hypothetical protein [Candidatus Eremiobacteraeota bacterium]
MISLPGSVFWASLLIWQLIWLSQSAPSLHPDPWRWWSALLLAMLSLGATSQRRAQAALILLMLAGLVGLGTVSSVLFRCLVFWSYWAGFAEAVRRQQSAPGRLTRAILSSYLILFGLQLFLVMGEFWMRYLAWSNDPTRIPCLSYSNTPWKAGPLYAAERNHLGLRSPELSPFKPPGKKRVLFLGDSVTFGLGVPLQDTFIKRIEEQLGPDVEAINLSAAGLNLQQEVEALMTQGGYYEVDAVVWVFFPNDIEHMGWELGYSGIEPSLDSLYRSWLFYEYLKGNYNLALGALGWRETYLSGLLKAYSEDKTYGQFANQMALMSAICQRRNQKLGVVLFPFMEDLQNYPLTSVQNKVGADLAQMGIPHLDLTPTMTPFPTRQLQLNPRFDHHPNVRANQLAADQMAPFVAQLLK